VSERDEEHGHRLCRVLEPPDPWLDELDQAVRASEFRGRYQAISVYATDTCSELTILAGFYGPSGRAGPVRPSYFRFGEQETVNAGGKLKSTDCNQHLPPECRWPLEYNEAHHDIVEGQDEVASYMAERSVYEVTRIVVVTRGALLKQIAIVLARNGVYKRFHKYGWRRLRRLLRDGLNNPDEARLWASIAMVAPHLLQDETSQRYIRQLYQEREELWEEIAERVPTLKSHKLYSTG
jgi:hypothetical protein